MIFLIGKVVLSGLSFFGFIGIVILFCFLSYGLWYKYKEDFKPNEQYWREFNAIKTRYGKKIVDILPLLTFDEFSRLLINKSLVGKCYNLKDEDSSVCIFKNQSGQYFKTNFEFKISQDKNLYENFVKLENRLNVIDDYFLNEQLFIGENVEKIDYEQLYEKIMSGDIQFISKEHLILYPDDIRYVSISMHKGDKVFYRLFRDKNYKTYAINTIMMPEKDDRLEVQLSKLTYFEDN